MSRPAAPAAIIALCLLAGPLEAAPPADADMTYSPWFRNLADPDTTLSCCDVSDCRYVEARIAYDHYEVLVGDVWLPVPEGKIIRDAGNPTGRPVLCWSRALGVTCFVPGPGV